MQSRTHCTHCMPTPTTHPPTQVHLNSLRGVQLLLEAGAKPDAADGESGW